MKNNWIQYLSLVLCAIMLIIIIAQGKKLDEYQNVNVDMKGDGTGIFSGQIFLPVEGNNEVFLCTQISGGGLTTKEELGGWGDLSMLLPLQNSGGGWSGPEYRDGVMSSQFSISIRGFANRMLKVYEDQDGPASVQNPEFYIYKNGELEQTLQAITDNNGAGGVTSGYNNSETLRLFWQ